jgi:transcriptional regulator with XRE-family HTH domain
MDRKEMLATFRERLDDVIRHSGLTRSAFAAGSAIDRSTLSQLLSPTNRRLPRVETLAEVAATHQVSVDWLLGLSNAGPMQAEMMREQAAFERNALSPNDERLIAWFEQARGYKVRYVPSTLPDMLKTDDLIRFELGEFVTMRPEQQIGTAAARLAWTRSPGSDLECCNSVQSVESFARGEGIWRALPHAQRIEQIEHMIELTHPVPHAAVVPVRRPAALRRARHHLRAATRRAVPRPDVPGAHVERTGEHPHRALRRPHPRRNRATQRHPGLSGRAAQRGSA